MPSRRHFLATSTAAIAVATLPTPLFAERLGGEVFTNGSLGAYAQGILSQANFESRLGSIFKAFLDNDKVAYLRLQTVTGTSASSTPPLPTQGRVSLSQARRAPTFNSPQITSFQLSFSTGGAIVTQGSYLLDNDTLGRFACFLVPGAEGFCGATFAYLPGGPSYLPTLPTRPPLSPIAPAGGTDIINSRQTRGRIAEDAFD
jgi:hypothetical protein